MTCSRGYDLFENICTLKDKNYNPLDKQEYKYIELSNIGKSGDITDCTTALGEELPTRARRKVSSGNIIVSSIEGSLDSCALVTKKYNDSLCSTGFYVVNSNKINPETLLVLFKSKPMQSLLKRSCSGTILTAFSKTELDKIPIPLIDSETQENINAQINESFQLKNQSEHLLEVAKRAVEIAIEEDEEAAMRYIEKETT
ncbi:MAG: restriction endonuclease subunit S [Dysgonamonadaceae bacterium]|nr:restriction endonuclease subunit S [Dysgonamonadaceae bacterium]